jgi:uncharacterized protein (DUF849 family)
MPVAQRQGHHHLRHHRLDSHPVHVAHLPVTPNDIVDSAFEAAEAGQRSSIFTPATPDEARDILHLKGANAVSF